MSRKPSARRRNGAVVPASSGEDEDAALIALFERWKDLNAIERATQDAVDMATEKGIMGGPLGDRLEKAFDAATAAASALEHQIAELGARSFRGLAVKEAVFEVTGIDIMERSIMLDIRRLGAPAAPPC